MRHTYFLLLFLSFSCNPISQDDLEACWRVDYDLNESQILFHEICFQHNQVNLIDSYTFKQKKNYELNAPQLLMYSGKDTFNYEITRLEKDTLEMNGCRYYRQEIFTSNLESFNLIDIKTDRLLRQELVFSKTPNNVIHFYKSNENIKIRLGYNNASFDDLPLFLENRNHYKIILFLGEGITLKDLKRIYYHIASERTYKVKLILKNDGINDFHYFLDRFHFFEEEINNYFNEFDIKRPPPPPPVDFMLNKEDFLQQGQEIKINQVSDSIYLETMKKDIHYLISINSDLSIEDYIRFKTQLYQKIKANKLRITSIID